jgi:hypothetical protein
MLQLMIYSVVARQHQRMVFIVWVGLAALLCLAPFVSSLTGLLTAVMVIDSVLFLTLLAAVFLAPSRADRAVTADSAPVS